MTLSARTLLLLLPLGLAACGEQANLPVSAGTGPDPELPPPNATLIPTVNIAPAAGWPEGKLPAVAPGFEVRAYAGSLDHPRWLYVLPNGDVLVAETNAPPRPEDSDGLKGMIMSFMLRRAGAGVPSADRITLLRDEDGDGTVDLRTLFLEDLHSPFGMVLVGDDFYVANTDALVRFPYEEGQTEIAAKGETVVALPGGELNHHWTKNVIVSPDGSKLYVTVGSNSNVGENGMAAEEGRAAIWEVDPESGEHRIFASGLRNPNGMDFEPESGALWTVVNERDEIGSDLVPDYMTSVEDGGFYGWPYSYYGDHVDERVEPQRPELVAEAIVPDYALGPHTASLGLIFAEEATLGGPFEEGVFIGQHGSWNRQPRSGYKVIFVPFEGGQPAGDPVDVLSGFISEEDEALGRPVDVAIDQEGALLVTDDVGNIIWRVSRAASGEVQAAR
jgi:glucose/arabinose dehydrogenase